MAYYLTQPEEIKATIDQLSHLPILWVDTEVADYKTKTPRLSLIQISANSADFTGEQVFILDVLDQADLIRYFIELIMTNEAIAKVFHHAAFDLKLLGKKQAKNIICTLELAKALPYYLAPKPDNSLKTLAERLCHFPAINKDSQGSDWGIRPLSSEQLHYAKLDPVYTAQVHHRLLQLHQQTQINPQTDSIDGLTRRYRQLEHDWKLLDSEVQHLKERLKAAMKAQGVESTTGFKLSRSSRTTQKINLSLLAEAIANQPHHLNTSIILTKALQEELADLLEQLPVETSQSTMLTLKTTNIDRQELPF